MATIVLPMREEEDLADAIADAVRAGDKLAITGGGSKAGLGAEVEAKTVDMSGFAGVVDYDPAELVLTVRAGTPLADVEALVAGERQMLAFEPFDHGPVFGGETGAATIGGVVAAAVSGSRRVSAGGARDHVLGFRAVSGRSEAFVAGAKVVKNVTGYDLPKLVAGSWGRLCAVTELSLKVLPRPEMSTTYFVIGLDAVRAVRAMAAAMGSQAEVACAAHSPASSDGDAVTGVRIEGFEPSVRARGEMLDRLLAQHGRVERAEAAAATEFWAKLRTLTPLPADDPLWRVNVPPGRGPEIADELGARGARWLMDWAGGLIWLTIDGGAAGEVRAAAARAGGHATLVRADRATRATVRAFHPPASGLAALEERVRRAFDPAGVFETGRF